MPEERLTIDEIRKLLTFISKGYKVPKIVYDTIRKVAKVEIEDKDRVVLVKRDPDIGRGRIQAMYVKIVEGNAIEFYPPSVVGFGADFDGDSVAVYLPLSKEAQAEARSKMVVATSNEKIDSQNFAISNEMLGGLYVLTTRDKGGVYIKMDDRLETLDADTIEKYKDKDPGKRVIIKYKGSMIQTTLGRVVFNSLLPDYVRFWDKVADKKTTQKLLSDIIAVNKNDYGLVIDNLMKFGFYYSTVYPLTVSLDMLTIPKSLEKKKQKLLTLETVEEKDLLVKEMEKDMMDHLKNNVPDIYKLVVSGAVKSASQVRQIMVAKGLIQDPSGNILPPITNSFTDGYTPKQYFDASAAARKGVIDRALNTAYGGYEYRKIIYVVGNVKASLDNPDCETNLTLNVKCSNDMFKRLQGRYVLDSNNKVVPVDSSMIGRMIRLRSPIYCQSWKICRTCYGELLRQVKSENVGIISAQEVGSLSERIMKCADGLVHYNGKLVSLTDLFDMIDSNIIVGNGCETKIFSDDVLGRNGNTRTYSIQKHKPTDEMYYIKTKSGHTMICQGNHPLFIKKESIIENCPNKTTRLIGDNTYASYWKRGTSRVLPCNYSGDVVVTARDVKKYDSIWVSRKNILSNSSEDEPEIDGYLCGAYCGDGFTTVTWKNRQFGISQCNGDVKDRIILESSNFKHYIHEKYILYIDKDNKLSDIIFGGYSYEKRLNSDFINYSKKWLNSFLGGLIDTDGSVFNDKKAGTTKCRIYTGSYYLIQQLQAICIKLGYYFNTNIVPWREKGNIYNGIEIKQKREHFSFDISFYKSDDCEIDSEKIKNLGSIGGVCGNYSKDSPIEGYDVVKIVKKINWDYNVYDLKTNTDEFMLGCVQNHNSFHLGGIVSFDTVDIYKDILSTVDEVALTPLKKVSSQKENTLYLENGSARINIDSSRYLGKYAIEEQENDYTLPIGIFSISFESGLSINVRLERKTIVYKTKDILVSEDGIISIKYEAGDKLFTATPAALDYTKVTQRLDELISGKDPASTVPLLYQAFYNTLHATGNWDSVHLEVLIGNVLRAKANPQLPARMKKPFDYEMYSIKNLPSIISWPLGLAFENFTKSIEYGLTSPKGPESEIEKIIVGEDLSF